MKFALSVLTGLIVLTAAVAPTAVAQTEMESAAFVRAEAVSRSAEPRPSLLGRRAGVHVENVRLSDALDRLQRRSGVPLAFSSTFLPSETVVSCSCSDATVEEALEEMLAGLPVSFRMVRSQVVIRERARPVEPAPTLTWHPATVPERFAAGDASPSDAYRPPREVQGTVTGRVTNVNTGQPIAGVQVYMPALDVGTLTRENGRFLLANVPVGTQTLVAERIGYTSVSQQITVAEGEATVVDVELREEALSLDEIVVTGQAGEARVREMGTSMGRLDPGELEAIPAARPQDVLMGRVAGVSVNLGGGQPGTDASIRLRGNSSISQGNQPLIYVDGVRIFSEHAPAGPSSSSGTLGLNSISPEDIDRIEIIRGAAASTLYGTEASSGVIQIFTKRGFSGAPQWNFEVGGGVHHLGFFGPYWNKAENPMGLYMNACRGPDYVSFGGEVSEDVTCPEDGDWIQNGLIQNYALSVRGGSGGVSYYLSGNFNSEGSTAPQGWGKRGGVRANLSFEPLDGLQVGWNSQYTRRASRYVPEGGNIQSFVGQITRGPAHVWRIDGKPAGELLLRSQIYDWRDHYVSGLTLRHQHLDNLAHRLTVGYDYNVLNGQDLYEFGNGRYPDGRYYARDWRQTVFSVDYSSTLTNDLTDAIRSSFSWGGQYFYETTRNVSTTSFDFAGPGEPTLSSGSRQGIDEERIRVVNAGFFLQEQLGFDDRFFVTAGIRLDGNSAFGRDFGIQPYPKIQGSYVISEEAFWPSDLIESMRLRTAVGEAGKAPGAFDAVRVWNSVAGDDGQPGFTPGRLGNPELGPERTREYEAGFDATAWDDRLDVEFTWYRQDVFDALVPVSPPPSTGFQSSQLENIGELRNSGIELGTELALVQNRTYNWLARLNYSTSNSEAIDLGGRNIALGSSNEVREGHPVPVFVGLKIVNADEFADPITEDNAVLGPVYPDTNIGVGTTFRVGGSLSIDALGEFVRGGNNVYPMGEINARRNAFPPCFSIQRKFEARMAGDASALDDVPAKWRARCGNAYNNDWARYDVWTDSNDFFRLRTVSIAYQLPDDIVPGASSATVSLQGRNLYTSTEWIGLDPESNRSSGSSLSRRGWSNWPTPKTFLATVRVGF